MAAAQPAERVRLANFKNITMREPNGALVKTSGGGSYNATATSADFIAGANSTRRGISCRIPESFAAPWMMGLVSAPHGHQQPEAMAESTDYRCLAFAACVTTDRTLWVFENGTECGRFGSVKSGDSIEIVLTSENPLSIEHRINGKVQYKSKTPIVFPLFPKICASYEGPLAEDLCWIEDPAPRSAELQARIAELQTQLRVCEEEKRDLHAGTEAKQAEIEGLLAVNEQHKKEIKAGSDALVAVTKENAQLLVRLEVAREASSAASDVESLQSVVEEQKKEVTLRNQDVLALRKENTELQMQLEAERGASRAAAEEKARAEQLQKELKTETEARLAALEDKAELQMQLEANKEASQAAAEQKVGVEALHSAFEQLKRDMKAEIEALLAVSKEKAAVPVQLQAEREASCAAAVKKEHEMRPQGQTKAPRASLSEQVRLPLQQPEAEEAASCAWADEKLELEIGALRFQKQSQAFEKVIGELADENARLQMEKKQMHAEMQRLVWSDEQEAKLGTSLAPALLPPTPEAKQSDVPTWSPKCSAHLSSPNKQRSLLCFAPLNRRFCSCASTLQSPASCGTALENGNTVFPKPAALE